MEIRTFDEERAAEAVAAAWEKYRPAITAQVDALEAAAATMLSGSEEPRRRAERDAHRLAGSVGTFGFLDAARTAGEIERLLQSVVDLTDVELLRLSELVVKLRDDLERDDVPQPASAGDDEIRLEDDELPSATSAEASPLVLVAGRETDGSLALRDLLRRYGLVAEAIEGLGRFWDELNALGPDLVILDIDGIDEAWAETVAAVRADPRWSWMPILVLTAHVDENSVAGIFTAGADDFVAKPVLGPELLARIAARLERLRLWRELTSSDPLTGLANRRRSIEQLGHLFETSRETGDVVAVTMLDVDHLRVANDAGGFEFGDRILVRLSELIKRQFPFDVSARWAGEEFLIGMYGTSSEDAVMKVADLLDSFRDEELRNEDDRYVLTFSAGVAEFPRDGTTSDDLVRAARAALRSAKQGGGARVLPLPRDAQRKTLDVLIIENDEVLAKLLISALETRGYESRWIPDGRSAVAALVGDPPSIQPKLILLDVDLADLDGLGVLRRLHSEGLLDSIDVVMLTGRSAELEMVKALEMGAADHIAKPFSIPELMEKIREAIGTL